MPIADLAPRAGGLVPFWGVLLAGLVWAGALAFAARHPDAARRPEWTREVGAAGALLLAHLLFFWRPLLTSAEVPRGGGDLNSFFFPLHAFSAAQIRQGHLPLWNPSLHGGMPQFANFQAAVLYPPNLIAYFLARPFQYGALELLAIAHYLIASLGAYLLGRSLGMGRPGAVAAGIVFPYSGFLVAHLGHYSMLCTAAWIPWLLLTVRLMTLRRSWLWAVAAGFVLFLMTSAGHQQTLLYALTVTAIWWLFWLATRDGFILKRGWFAPVPITGGAGATVIERTPTGRVPRLRPLAGDALRFGGALALGIGLAMPVLLPSLQMARWSVRARLSYEQASEFSVEPIALLHLLVPKAFGSNPTDYWGPFSNGEIWSYVGIATLVLAAIAVAARPSAVRWFLAGLALAALLYALGPATPLHGWVYRFGPLYDLIRAPARALSFFDLALALLAGFGVGEIAHRGEPWAARLDGVLRAGLRALLIGLAALALVVIPLFYSLILGTNDPSNRPIIAVDGLNLLLLYAGLTALLVWAVLRGHLRGPGAAVAAIGLIVVDLFGATASFNPTTDDLVAGFRHSDTVAFLRQAEQGQGSFRIEGAAASWQPNLALVAGLDDIGGVFDPMQPGGYEAVRQAAVADRGGALYDLLGVRYLITDAKAPAPAPGFSKAHETDDGLVIWENAGARPRAWLAYQATSLDLRAVVDRVLQPGFDPSKTLLLTGSLAPAGAGGTGTVRVTGSQASSVTLVVDTDRPAYLVLADAYYPGWRATVDGQPTPVAAADGVLRAITVPAGSHEVVFRFDPPLVKLGFLLGGLSLLGGAGMLALGLWTRRGSRTDAT